MPTYLARVVHSSQNCADESLTFAITFTIVSVEAVLDQYKFGLYEHSLIFIMRFSNCERIFFFLLSLFCQTHIMV